MRSAKEWSQAVHDAATEPGHLEVVQWAFSKGIIGTCKLTRLATAAAKAGRWDVLGWLLPHYTFDGYWQTPCWHEGALQHVFSLPEEQALIKLQSLDNIITVGDIGYSGLNARWSAAKAGYISSLQWLQDQRPACAESSSAAATAASSGHLHIIQWPRSQDSPWPWDDSVCRLAAIGGHLDMLKWL